MKENNKNEAINYLPCRNRAVIRKVWYRNQRALTNHCQVCFVISNSNQDIIRMILISLLHYRDFLYTLFEYCGLGSCLKV